MPVLRIPTPLRPYTDGQSEVHVQGDTVEAALEHLTDIHPALQKHLYRANGELRAFVNLFLNDEDIRHLQGTKTPLHEGDRLMILPSIAGGTEGSGDPRPIDHAALRTNQAFIIALSVAAFVTDAPWLAGAVAVVMGLGTLLGQPGFGWVYRRALKPRAWVPADVVLDHTEPHRFAQGFGGVVLGAGTLALWAGASAVGWALVWLVIFLAAVNLFAGFCLGCALYYWLNRLRVPGFTKSPPGDITPGTRPEVGA